MYSTPDAPQQWSVHAEFTINHPGVGNPQNPPKTGTIQDENGVRMLYSWTANDRSAIAPHSQIARSESGSSKTYEADKLYGFQKGNLFFTSTPPPKPMCRLNVPGQDSTYGSEPSSCASSSCHPFNRKCRSTCNIVLSSNAKRKGAHLDNVPGGNTSCGRTQSLRCQTPSVCTETKGEGFYGCGDPWCHHLHFNDDFSSVRRVSPVTELCEDLGNAPQENCGEAGCSICVRNFENKRSIKRDVSVQTYEMVSKCTSPMLKTAGSETSSTAGRVSKLKRGRVLEYNRKRQSSKDSVSPVSLKRDIFEQNSTKLARSSSNRGAPLKGSERKGSESDTKSGDSSKKPRTIHIDVYCTGTEIESESDSSSSSSSSRSKTVSTPQTVFESKNMSVTHKNADDKTVPYRLEKTGAYYLAKTNSTSMEKEDSDVDDGSSTAYPSKLSSYSTMGRSLSSMSSFPNSVTPFSISTCTVPDYESSVGNTSWKDTFSDIDSLLHSRSSVPQNDSSYFIPRRIEEESNGKEDSSKVTSTTNSVSLHPNDSFDYADSQDKLRIKRMERMWRNRMGISTESRNNLLQQQENLQDIVNKRLSRMNVSKSKDSDSDASDKSEKGWTVLKNEDKANKNVHSSTKPHAETSLYRSPSAVIIKERLSLDPSLGSPFTIFPGKYTQPRSIAKRFGPVITVFKKPGHHIGPAKNPSCSCEHCRRYFESTNYRTRTCSLGDTPSTPFFNWKGLKKND